MIFFQYGKQEQKSLLSYNGGWNGDGGQFRVKNTSNDTIIEANDREIVGNSAAQGSGGFVDADSQYIAVADDGRRRISTV